jgi:hypothetical protein
MRKISLLAAVALAAIVAMPGASDAASKRKSATDPASCAGGGCTAVNPDRVTQPCNGSNCYKRTSRKHKSSSDTSKADTSKTDTSKTDTSK